MICEKMIYLKKINKNEEKPTFIKTYVFQDII